jgi:hypothetical protein
MAFAPIALAVIATAATGAKMYTDVQAAKAANQALDIASKNEQIKTNQKQLANMDVMQKVLDAQQASAGARGYTLNSASLNAIERDTINRGAKEGRNIELEGSIAQTNIGIERANVKRSLFARMFGDVAGLGMNIAGLSQQLPKKESANEPSTKTSYGNFIRLTPKSQGQL